MAEGNAATTIAGYVGAAVGTMLAVILTVIKIFKRDSHEITIGGRTTVSGMSAVDPVMASILQKLGEMQGMMAGVQGDIGELRGEVSSNRAAVSREHQIARDQIATQQSQIDRILNDFTVLTKSVKDMRRLLYARRNRRALTQNPGG